jgi:hypothetical protein
MPTHYTGQPQAERCFLCGLPLDEDPNRTQGMKSYSVLMMLKLSTDLIADYHPGCHRVLSGAVVYDLFHVNRLEFYPQRARLEERKVLQWASSNLTEALSLHFARSSSSTQLQLSRTSVVLRSIAKTLLLDYMTMTTEAQLTSPREFTFLLTKPIFAQIADFQGTKYVTALSNNEHEIPDNAIQLFQPLEGQKANVVYVAANHLGVVQLVVTNSTTWLEVGEVPDVWWFAIDIPCGECLLLAHHDVSFHTKDISTIN